MGEFCAEEADVLAGTLLLAAAPEFVLVLAVGIGGTGDWVSWGGVLLEVE